MTKRNEYTQAGQALVQHQQGKDVVRGALERHQAFLKARVDQLGKWVTGGVRPEALIRFALLDLQQNEKLRQCDPGSIYLGLLACAQTGLEPGALKGEAYLVPFARKAQFIAGYKGLIKMARRSRDVQTIGAEVVHERDSFDLQLGTEPRLLHRPALGDRGLVIGAYSVARLQHGGRELEWMDRDQLDGIRRIADARGKSPAWRDWESEMQRKSVIRRLCKRLPLGQDYFVASTIEDAQDSDNANAVTEVLDVLTDGTASATEEASRRGQQMAPKSSTEMTEEEMAAIIASENQEHSRG